MSTVYLRGEEEVYTGRPALPASSGSLWTKPLVGWLRVETGRWTLGEAESWSFTHNLSGGRKNPVQVCCSPLEFLRSVTKRGAQVAPLLQL